MYAVSLEEDSYAAARENAWSSPALLWWFGAGWLAIWVTYVVHEAAHYSMAGLLFSTFAFFELAPYPVRRLFSIGAGPVATLAILAWAAWIASSRREGKTRWGLPVAIALACAAASRLLLIAPFALSGNGVFDESTIASILHLPVLLVWSTEALFAAVIVAVLLGKISRDVRHRVVVSLGAGIIVGWITTLWIASRLGLPT